MLHNFLAAVFFVLLNVSASAENKETISGSNINIPRTTVTVRLSNMFCRSLEYHCCDL